MGLGYCFGLGSGDSRTSFLSSDMLLLFLPKKRNALKSPFTPFFPVLEWDDFESEVKVDAVSVGA